MRAISAALIVCAVGCLAHGPAAKAATEKVLYSFCRQQNCADGKQPFAGLISVDGMLYGTTYLGGTGSCNFGCGTLFAIDPETGAETVLHSFQFDTTDGFLPSSGLMDIGDTLYGMTRDGGSGDCYQYDPCGTVFSFDLTSDTETVLYSFCSRKNCKDGSWPNGGVIVGSTLYGVTTYGGKTGLGGTLFSLKLESGVERKRYSFGYESTNGFYPEGSLIDVDGTLYGVTSQGGTGSCYGGDIYGCGTVFSFDPKSGVETVLHSFLYGAADGTFPYAGVIEVDHTLYGTTFAGGPGNCFAQQGATGCGTVFSLDLETGVETVLYFFCSQQNCADGERPYAGLIDVNGKLYGTTYQGGANGWGTVFSIDLKTGKETVVYSFCSRQNCADGSLPSAGLINVNGTLYGTTNEGGARGQGTVFSIVP